MKNELIYLVTGAVNILLAHLFLSASSNFERVLYALSSIAFTLMISIAVAIEKMGEDQWKG